MSRLLSLVLTLATVAGPALAAPVFQSEPELALRTVRFYRADSKQTRVKTFAQIPYSLLQATANGPGGVMSYQVTFRVADSAGLTLHQQSWRNRTGAQAKVPGAVAIELVDFALAPGSYKVEVTVEDSVTGRKTTAAAPIEAFRETPAASDLLLAPRMRLADDEATTEPGEFAQGNTLVTAAAELTLTPLRSKAYYLFEAYSPRPDSGSLAVSVQDPQGKDLVRSKPAPVTIGEGGGVLRGQLDLAGLPPGEYTLRALLTIGDRTIERSAPLLMAGLDQTLARDAQRRAAERDTDEGYFGAMSAEELAEARAPLVYIQERADRLDHFDDLSLDAKRKVLAEFWQRRDPTKGTPKNEAREAFYRAIAYANESFREGGRNARAGWRSDRGRIFARNGAPEDVLSRQQEGEAPRYQVWRYTRGQSLYYVFADRTGFGAYELVASNDLREPSHPDIIRVLTLPAVQDIERYLNINILQQSR